MIKSIAKIGLLFFICNCTPSKQFISPIQNDGFVSLNEELKNKKVRIIPFEGASILSDDVQFVPDSLWYYSSGKKSMPISSVKSIVVSPKESTSKIASITLFALGGYSITSVNNSSTWGEAYGRTYLGIFGIGAGIGVLIFGNNAESTTYYFLQ